MKRFYALVSTHKAPAGYEIHLDGRAVKTPMRKSLVAPSQNFANDLVAEWSAQGEIIQPDTMPLTQILSTRLDRIADERAAMQPLILAYLDTDLVCYFADKPDALRARQEAIWSVSLSWFEEIFKAPLLTTRALAALSQPTALHAAVRDYVDGMDDDHFTILQLICALSGSLVLAMAFVERAVDAEHIYEAVRIEESYKDELYNAEKYGPDPAQDQKDKAMQRDLKAAERFLELID